MPGPRRAWFERRKRMRAGVVGGEAGPDRDLRRRLAVEAQEEEGQVLEELEQNLLEALEGAAGGDGVGGAVGGGAVSRLLEGRGLGLREEEEEAGAGGEEAGADGGAGWDGTSWQQVVASDRRGGGGAGGIRKGGGRKALVERLRAKVEENRLRNLGEG